MIDQKALEDLSYGMYVVSTEYESKYYGCLIDSVMQQNFSPAIITISLNNSSYTSEIIKNSMKFSLSVLSKDIKPNVISTFGFNSSKNIDKFQNINYEILDSKNPVLTEDICSYLDLEVVEIKELEDHTMFFAKVVLGKKAIDIEPMTYAYYYNKLRIENVESNISKIERIRSDNMLNLEFYLCERCGNLVEVLNKGNIEVNCCGTNMKKIIPNTTDGAVEKHVPVILVNDNVLVATVGSVEHPMTEEHYIKSMYVVADNGMLMRKNLKPGEKPEITVDIEGAKKVTVFAYCNLHGVWKEDISL